MDDQERDYPEHIQPFFIIVYCPAHEGGAIFLIQMI